MNNPLAHIRLSFENYLKKTFALSDELAKNCTFHLNVDPHKEAFGDLSSNAALVLAKELQLNPRQLAQKISTEFSDPALEKIEIAGPGFLNAFLTQDALKTLGRTLIEQKSQFFKLGQNSPHFKYDIEFVSANPTGPLHFGHGRGGIIGDVLGNILSFIGNQVVKEFYINDAGNQIERLGASLKARCLQQLGIAAQVPEDGYQGEYLIELAKECIATNGKEVADQDNAFFAAYAKEHLLALIKKTLDTYGIHFDIWFSEKQLHDNGSIAQAITILEKNGRIYESDGALWFKSTAFGDDKDRVVRKSTGEWTYVAADIAYLLNKAQRGFDKLILILGHDHHGYVSRLQGIRQALGIKPTLDVILYQKVTMKEEGVLVKMSKRAGIMVTLDDVIETVGKDVARFFYLHRKADAQLEFDLALALKQSEENPVYYLQYAYVRTGSILHKANSHPELQNITLADSELIGTAEAALIKKIASLKDLLESIANSYHTHQLSYYALELADLFHSYYAKNRVIELENVPLSRARLLMIELIRSTFAITLDLLEISKPERM